MLRATLFQSAGSSHGGSNPVGSNPVGSNPAASWFDHSCTSSFPIKKMKRSRVVSWQSHLERAMDRHVWATQLLSVRNAQWLRLQRAKHAPVVSRSLGPWTTSAGRTATRRQGHLRDTLPQDGKTVCWMPTKLSTTRSITSCLKHSSLDASLEHLLWDDWMFQRRLTTSPSSDRTSSSTGMTHGTLSFEAS